MITDSYIIMMNNHESHVGCKFWTGSSWDFNIDSSKIYPSKESAENELLNDLILKYKNVTVCELNVIKNNPQYNWLSFNVISPVDFEHEQG